MEERGARAIFFSISTFYKLRELEVYIGSNNICYKGALSISTHIKNFISVGNSIKDLKKLSKLTLNFGYNGLKKELA